MTFEIRQHHPSFIQVQYDIPQNSSIRIKVLRLLKQAGFVRQTDSVYYGYFHLKAIEAAEVIGKTTGSRCIITTPTFPDAQVQMLTDKYEKAFMEQFKDLMEVLDQIEGGLTGEIKVKNPKTKEMEKMSVDRLGNMIKYANMLVGDLEHAVANRRERGEKADYSKFERRLRELHAFTDKLTESYKKKKLREEGKK